MRPQNFPPLDCVTDALSCAAANKILQKCVANALTGEKSYLVIEDCEDSLGPAGVCNPNLNPPACQ